ncbi:hypothetical protein F4861DRAFT_289654 [Xylaria intraflava]|nr:hypothetical protein F4861DRAFT_289654 [Xylaria intraflava]
MGAKASKPAQTASRRFPTRTPIPPQHQASAKPRHPEPEKTVKDNTTRPETQDPVPDLNASENQTYSRRLREMGIVTPQPTRSNSSTANPFTGASASTYTQTSPNLPPSQPANKSASQPPLYPPSTQNRTLNALEARRALQARAEAEFHDPSRGREFLDAGTLRKALLLRARGTATAEIEGTLRLKSGVVARLGPVGVVVPVEGAEMNRQTWGGLHE